MGAGHNHSPAEADASRMIPRMIMAAAILAAFFVVELTTSLLINSIALLADAGHMLTDVVAVFMGLGALMLARRRTVHHLRGHRTAQGTSVGSRRADDGGGPGRPSGQPRGGAAAALTCGAEPRGQGRLHGGCRRQRR